MLTSRRLQWGQITMVMVARLVLVLGMVWMGLADIASKNLRTSSRPCSWDNVKKGVLLYTKYLGSEKIVKNCFVQCLEQCKSFWSQAIILTCLDGGVNAGTWRGLLLFLRCRPEIINEQCVLSKRLASNIGYAAPPQGQQQPGKQTSDATSLWRLCCRDPVCWWKRQFRYDPKSRDEAEVVVVALLMFPNYAGSWHDFNP